MISQNVKQYEKRFPLSLTPKMHEKVRRLAHRKGSTMAEEIRKAIELYIMKEGEGK